MPRPKKYGPMIGFNAPALLNLKIRALAQERGVGISDLIREALEEKYSNYHKPQRIPYK